MKSILCIINLRFFLTILLSLSVIACAGGENEGGKGTSELKQEAIQKIKTFAETGYNPPTLQIYLNAGLTGVTVNNLDKINNYIKGLEPEDVDTISELEEITNNLAVNILPVVDAGENKTIVVGHSVNLTGSASDSDGSIVKYEWKVGSRILATTPTFTYTSISIGPNILTLTVTDNDGGVTFDKVIITVTAPPSINHAPIAQDLSVTTTAGSKALISLSGSDEDGDNLSYQIVSSPSHGTAIINGKVANYMPNNGYTGNESFTYKVNDGTTDSNTATVNIIISADNSENHTPTANSITINMVKNTTKVFTLSGSDADGDNLSFIKISDTSHGVLSLNGHSVTYTPSSNFIGTDSFGYKVNDGKVSSTTAYVFIHVKEYPEYTKSFTQAKKEAAEIYLAHQEAFYSGCEYYAVGKKLVPLKSTCGYQTRKNENRASRIEWEHVVSMWAMAHNFECWINGGRSNCNSDEYRKIETDLHNLVPAIGEINGDRSNYYHGIISGEPRVYGSLVDVEVDFKKEIFEPKEDIRGDIARMYLYMQQRYGLSLDSSRLQLYQSWSSCDPVDNWERERNLAIEAIQGNDNPFVTNYVADASACGGGNDGGGNGGGNGGGDNGGVCNPLKKTCGDMDSCSEANFYLHQCGLIKLDGDKDGVPCESRCK